MRVLLAILILTLVTAVQSSGREPGAKTAHAVKVFEVSQVGGSGLPPGALNAAPTFLTLDITIDPKGQTLGAYQFELTSKDASFTVVGVEGGDHPAFDHGRPPYFDPIAQQGETDRLILAEYARPALAAEQLPTQSLRVATVHAMFSLAPDADEKPMLQVTLTAAGNAQGERIDADISHTFRTPGTPERPE